MRIVLSHNIFYSRAGTRNSEVKAPSSLLYLHQPPCSVRIASARRSQVGTGDRSERIRTYNFPQGRVTDHRIGLTLYKIDAVMDGDLEEITGALITADQAEKLRAQGESS